MRRILGGKGAMGKGDRQCSDLQLSTELFEGLGFSALSLNHCLNLDKSSHLSPSPHLQDGEYMFEDEWR